MPKAPEWLNDTIQELYPPCRGSIREVQQAIKERRGVNIAYMTISDRLKGLGLERPRAKGKAPPREAPTHATPDLPAPEPADPVMDEALSAIADMIPVDERDIKALSSNETEILEYCERVIAEGIQTFVEVGRALLVIRDQQLYRQTYATFEAYCRERWDLSRTYAYQLIGASEVVDHVAAVSDVVPTNEAQARPLASLPPEQQVEVWQEAVETAPPSGITATHVKRTVARVKAKDQVIQPKPKAPETRRPARQEVQEGLIWGLREVGDEDIWGVLGLIWGALNDLAPRYPSLPGMLNRVEKRFPDGDTLPIEIAHERKSIRTKRHNGATPHNHP
jgi:hypothetical protein